MASYTLEKNEDTLSILLNGDIDENSNFTEIQLENFSNIVVDFKEVTGVNSCGIREWVTFVINEIGPRKLVYKNCGLIIIDIISTIRDFTTDNTFFESFELPYFCEMCSNEETQYINVEDLTFSDENIQIPSPLCSKCNSKMEFDSTEDQYLEFLKKMRDKFQIK